LTSGGGSAGVIKSIELPNQTYYNFAYDNYGLLSQISYPTGAVVTYTWNTPSSPNGMINFPGVSQPGTQLLCTYGYYAPMITQRTVAFDGVHTALVQNFSYTTAYNTGVQQATVQTTVYSSNGSTNLGTFKTVYNYAPTEFSFSDPDDQVSVPTSTPVEQTVQYYDYGETNLLETVTKGWEDQFRLGCQLETHDGSPLSGTFYRYGPGMSVTDKKEYDYGQISSMSQCPQAGTGGPITAPAGATRETAATYQVVGNTSDRPCSVVTKDSSGNKVAETDYLYDGGTTVCGTAGTASVASANTPIQHDSAYAYTASPQPPRGNATSVTRQCLQSSPACSSGNPTTTYSYDETGQTTSMKDPNGNTTQYSYKDSYSSGTPSGSTNAYLTTITDPLSHSATFMYSYADGQLTSSKDVNNNQVTSYKYNTPPTGCSFADGLDRLSEADFPDGGKTTYCYHDAAPSPTVTTAKLITSSASISTTTTFDGMGHAVAAQVTTDPDGITSTATTYDGTGQKYTATNPYRSTSDSTYGTTTYTYDALGRAKQVAEPDGSSVSTSYSVNQTTVTDEAGNQRISITDGLGRLTEMEEPGTGLQGATPGSGTVTIGGAEQTTVPATHSTGTFSFGQQTPISHTSGTITLYVNSVTVASVTYADHSQLQNVVQSLITAINGNPSSPVTASTGGFGGQGSITVTSIATGSGTNYTMSGTPTSSPQGFYVASASGMTGGQDSQSIPDTGTVSITVNGFLSSTSFGSSSTPASIASALASGFSASGSPVGASLSGSALTLTAIEPGSSSNYSLSTSVAWNTTDYKSPSFTATPSGSTLTGGSSASSGTNPLVTLYTYDAMNNLTCAVQKGTYTTAFTTCAAAPSIWRPRSFVYNSLSRLTSSTNPESNTAVTGGTLVPTTYTYDANGNLLSKTVPAQNQQGTSTTPVSYCYDPLNRLTAKSYSSSSSCASPVATYTYDQSACLGQSACYNVGRRTGMTDAAGSEAWSYDKMGRVFTDQRTTNGLTKSATYTYLPYVDGSIDTVTYPSGRVVTYTTGGAERLLSASDSSASYASGVHYAPQGAIASLVNNTNLSSTEIYNNRLQPCWIYTTSGTALPTSSSCTGTATTGNFQDLKYNFALGVSDNGNVMGITNNRDTTRSQVFAYDALNRLQSANTTSTSSTSSAHCWGESYGIDGWGNMSALAILNSQYSGCTQEPGFSVTASVQNQLPITGNQYDSAGNLWVGMVGGIPYTYTYNAENQMASVTGLSTTTNYLYDGDGKRTEKTGSKIYWYGADGAVLDETDPTGSFTNANFSEYIYFGGKRIARRDSAGDVFYYFADHLGTSRTMAQVLSGQTTGTLCYDADFYPFGGERAYTNICTQNYKFTGKERDSESGNDYFGARHYTSSMGRFMSVDPGFESEILELPQTWNRYSYVYNRPTFSNDPDGRCPPCIGALVGGAIEGGFDLGKQLYNNGGSLSDVSWREVGANALGGAVTGGLAVATGGTSLVANAVIGDVLAGATANVVGGIVTRTAEGDNADEVLSGTELSQDALAGFVGGAGGHVAEEFVHVPGEPVFKGRNMKEGMRRYNKAVIRRNSAVVKQTFLGASAHATTGGLTKWFEGLFFWQASQQQQQPKACVEAHDSSGQGPEPTCN
jgi:RHS repeat-associated protein